MVKAKKRSRILGCAAKLIALTVAAASLVAALPVSSLAVQKDVFYKSIYSNTSSGELSLNIQNWQQASKFDQGFILGDDGIYSVRLDMRQSANYNGGYHEMVMANRLNVADIVNTGELRFKLMLEADDPDRTAGDVNIYFKTYNDANPAWGNTKGIKIPGADEIKSDGEWHDVVIPLSSFIPSGKLDFSKLASLTLSATAQREDKYLFYFRNIEVYDIKYSAKFTVGSCGMNNDGKFAVNVKSSEVLDPATVTADKFTIDGSAASEVKCSGKDVELVFDIQPEFPSELVVNIGEGIRSVDDLEAEQTGLTVTVPELQNRIFADVTSKPTLSGGTVSGEVKITSIYAPAGAAKANVMLIVYDGEKIAVAKTFATGELKRSESESVQFTADGIADGIVNPRAELFFYGADGNKTPLAPMQSFSLN